MEVELEKHEKKRKRNEDKEERGRRQTDLEGELCNKIKGDSEIRVRKYHTGGNVEWRDRE